MPHLCCNTHKNPSVCNWRTWTAVFLAKSCSWSFTPHVSIADTMPATIGARNAASLPSPRPDVVTTSCGFSDRDTAAMHSH